MKYNNTYPLVNSNEDPPSLMVLKFQEYIRLRTVHPKPDYQACIPFFKAYAEELELKFNILECVKDKPIFILSWEGRDPSLKSLVLNSHSDVVPVFESSWSHDPFGADRIVKDGKKAIIGRGTQDMKVVGILYLETIRELKKKAYQPKRNIHVIFVPDEEIDGSDGMKLFVKSAEFKNLNVGLALDEGISNVNDAFKVFYGERTPWKVKFTTTGDVGHGSQFISNLATDKLFRIAKKLRDFRFNQEVKLVESPTFKLGDVTTINLTSLKSGIQYNVVPRNAEAVFDIRIAPTVNIKEFKGMLEEIAKEEDAQIEYISYFESGGVTSIAESYHWWAAFTKACKMSGHKIEPEVFPAATDSRYLRQIGVPAYGVSPLKNTPILLHDHDEFIYEDTLEDGLNFYLNLIPTLCDVDEE